MSDADNHHQDMKFLFGFFVGGLLGALVIFFIGTKEGKKAGKLLEEQGKDFLDDLQERLDELEKKGKEIAKQGEELKEEVIEHIEEKKDDLTVKAAHELDNALAHVEAIQERGRQTTASIRQRLFKNLPKRS